MHIVRKWIIVYCSMNEKCKKYIPEKTKFQMRDLGKKLQTTVIQKKDARTQGHKGSDVCVLACCDNQQTTIR